MTEQIVARIPVFLPGNNRNWDRAEGQMVIDEEGVMTIHLGEENAQRLADYAKQGILFQVSFDYRASVPKDDWEHIIMVGSTKELERALAAGWPLMNIVRTTITHLQGRRYKSIRITWEALEILRGAPGIYEHLHSDSIVMNAQVVIGDVLPPPKE